jgi:hypothetical protein
MDDEVLLSKAEEALTEIKVAQGLTEQHEMLEAADDAPPDRLAEEIAKAEGKRKPSLNDLLTQEPKKPDWPG